MEVVKSWLERMRTAWETADPVTAAELFADDAVYRAEPFSEPLIGRRAIAEYWRSATSTQDGVKVRFGRPVIEDDRAAVEWWTTMVDSGEETTDAGMLLLVFDGERCRELREYWNLAPGHHQPPEGWGQ